VLYFRGGHGEENEESSSQTQIGENRAGQARETNARSAYRETGSGKARSGTQGWPSG
jgi:hypothetical protein